MEGFSVSNDFKYCRDKINRISDMIPDIEHQFEYDNVELAKKWTGELMMEMEKLCKVVRTIPLKLGVARIDGKDIFDATQDAVSDNWDIKIGYAKSKWLCVKLPIVAPKINGCSSDILYEPLNLSLEKFFGNNVFVDKRPMVICYRFVYGKDIPVRNYHDHDNKEVKMITDTITNLTLIDDKPKYLNHYYCTATGIDSNTEVFLVPREEFSEWLEYESTLTEKGVILPV